jgi:hypothetical protein
VETDGTPPWAEAAIDMERAARLVREHGGVLTASALKGGGRRVTIELPAV